MTIEAIIYKQQEYLDNSKLLFCYSAYGKKTFISKGAYSYKSSNRIASLNLTKIECEFKDKDIQVLKGVKVIDEFEKIKTDYSNYKYACLVFEVIDKFIVDVEDNAYIYSLVNKVLGDENIELSVLAFMLKITKTLGIKMDIESVNPITGFSIKEGKAVDSSFMGKVDYNVLELNSVLRVYLYFSRKYEISQKDIEITKDFIKKYYEYHLDYSLKNI